MTALRIGGVIEVDKRDYKYGTGKLVLRVSRIGNRSHAADVVVEDGGSEVRLNLDGPKDVVDGRLYGPAMTLLTAVGGRG
jgi:hypothetical protein